MKRYKEHFIRNRGKLETDVSMYRHLIQTRFLKLPGHTGYKLRTEESGVVGANGHSPVQESGGNRGETKSGLTHQPPYLVGANGICPLQIAYCLRVCVSPESIKRRKFFGRAPRNGVLSRSYPDMI